MASPNLSVVPTMFYCTYVFFDVYISQHKHSEALKQTSYRVTWALKLEKSRSMYHIMVPVRAIGSTQDCTSSNHLVGVVRRHRETGHHIDHMHTFYQSQHDYGVRATGH